MTINPTGGHSQLIRGPKKPGRSAWQVRLVMVVTFDASNVQLVASSGQFGCRTWSVSLAKLGRLLAFSTSQMILVLLPRTHTW